MGRAQTKAIRKRDLVQATVICVNRYGYAESTIQRIAAEAGFTGGTIYRHFKNKNDLFKATMRQLLNLVLTEEREAVRGADNDLDRLRAVIASKFSPALFNSEFCTVWLHFWANAHADPEFLRIERLSEKLLRRSLLRYASRVLDAAEAEALTTEVALIIDGLWIAHAQQRSDLTSHTAKDIAQGCLEARLGR